MESAKSLLEIDLNEAPPLSSPRETLGSENILCRSCGKGEADVEGEMLVCVKCGRGFHMKCMGTKKNQGDWKCFSCLFTGNDVPTTTASTERLLDMNAPPPEEEEDVRGAECWGGGDLGRNQGREQNGGGLCVILRFLANHFVPH